MRHRCVGGGYVCVSATPRLVESASGEGERGGESVRKRV